MSVKKVLTEKQFKTLYGKYHSFLQRHKFKKTKPKLSDFFAVLRKTNKSFQNLSDKVLTNQIIAARRQHGEEEWPQISQLSKYKSPLVSRLIQKSHQSGLLAVEIYNKPLIQYRTEGYIVMMMVAWTSLFHAIFLNQGQNVKYKSGDDNFHDLRKCVNKYQGELQKEIEANLELLIGVRDIIVHRDNPEIDNYIFGYCQACLHNFEFLLIQNFGEKYQLQNSLAYSLQFSRRYTPEQAEAVKQSRDRNYYDVLEFVEKYEKNLFKKNPEITDNRQAYEFRVLMIPSTVSKSRAEAAIEYIDYDVSNPKISEEVDKFLFAVKRASPNGEFFTPTQVAGKVFEALKDKMEADWKFNASHHHARCLTYYEVRNTKKPKITKEEFCSYDSTFGRHKYTRKWIDYLIVKLSDSQEYAKIFPKKQ